MFEHPRIARALWVKSSALTLMAASLLSAAGAPANTRTSEVFVTGSEQAIIDRFASKVAKPDPGQFSNSVDHAFAVLLAKAYPEPQRGQLARAAVVALAQERERQLSKQASPSQLDTWASVVARTGSFESVLKELTAPGLKADRLVEAGLSGMLAASGWTSACVLSQTQADELKQMTKAREKATEERGILGIKLDHWPVIEVAPGGPAAQAGLRNGDTLTTVDSKDAGTAKTAREALSLLQGPAGAVVKLTAVRDGKKLSFDVTRALAGRAQVSSKRLEANVLVIRIPTFEGSGVAAKVKGIIEKAGAGKELAVILDVRDNGGGRPEEANGVADLFLDSKQLQICEFRGGERIAFKSKPGAAGARVIILTNKGTGSAAEMLAMALRDNSRATIVGDRTAGVLFGKDVAELVGGQTILFRTDPTVLSPTGRDYSLTGIPPDVEVADAKGERGDAVLSRALEFVRAR